MLDRALERCPADIDRTLLESGLRQSLIACGTSPQLKAAMPSKTVYEAWQEFITYTRDYVEFRQKAYGKFLHHVPARSPHRPSTRRRACSDVFL